MYWPWLVLGVVSRVGLDMLTNANRHRGYINRLCTKLLRFKEVLGMPVAIVPVWFIYSAIIEYTIAPHGAIRGLLIWGPYILIALDDYLNSDDDFHKKIKKAANKIKWKMTQPKLIARPE